MKIYKAIKIQEGTTKQTWSRLCEIQYSLSFEDLIECLVPHREGLRKPAGFKSDTISQQTFDQLIEALGDVVTRQKKVPLKAEHKHLIESVRSHLGMKLLLRTVDLILSLHTFSIQFQEFNFEMRRQVLPQLESFNHGIEVSYQNFTDLLLVSKLKLILSLHYTCLLGPSINDDMIKFIKRTIQMRKKVSEIWPDRLALLYVPTFLSFNFLKILRTKCLKRDLQTKLLLNLRADLARQLKSLKDKYLLVLNEEVSRLFTEFVNEPKIYNEGLLTCIRKVSGSEEVLMRTNENLKSKKAEQRASQNTRSKKSDRISMQIKNRSLSRQETLKVFQDAIKSIKNARGQRRQRRFSVGLKPIAIQPLNFNKYLSSQRTFPFKYFLEKIPLNIEFSVLFECGENRQPESVNCRVVIRNVSHPQQVILAKQAKTECIDGPKNNQISLVLKCLKNIFPLLSSSIYLPLLKNNISSIEAMEFINNNQNYAKLQIQFFEQVDFFNHVHELIILGCKSSLRFVGSKGYLINGRQTKTMRSLKILDDRDLKGRRIGLRLRRISSQVNNPQKTENKAKIKFQDEDLEPMESVRTHNSRLTIQLIYDDEIRTDEPTQFNNLMKYSQPKILRKYKDFQTMKHVYFSKKGKFILTRVISSSLCIYLPDYHTRIRLNENYTGRLVVLKLQMCSRLFISTVENKEQMLIAESKPCLFEEGPLQKLLSNHSVKFNSKNLVSFHSSIVIKSYEYSIISVFCHSALRFIYEVYSPSNCQKRYTHSDDLISSFQLGLCSLNGLPLVNYDKSLTDIRHVYSSAQWYADYIHNY